MKKPNPKTMAACFALAAVIAAGGFIGRSAAYLTDKKDAGATFTFGDVAIVLHEPGFDQDGQSPGVPNQETAKDPTISNNGSQDCVVFAKVTVPVRTFTPVGGDGARLGQTTAPIYYLKTRDAAASSHENSFNDGWVLLSSNMKPNAVEYLLGYRDVLPPSSRQIDNINDPRQVALLDSATTPVFSKVQLCSYLEGTLDPNEDHHVRVDAYAIQADGLAARQTGMTADELADIWDTAVNAAN